MFGLFFHKNCAVLGVQPDPMEKDTYNVKVLFNNDSEEFVPEIPLKLKGNPMQISKILTFLGQEFSKSADLEKTLNDLSIAPIRFEVQGDKVIAKDTHGKELKRIEGSIEETPSTAKVKEFTDKFFFSHKKKVEASAPPSRLMLQVAEVRMLWAEINKHRISKDKRTEKKMSLLKDFIKDLARQKGIPEDGIEQGLHELEEAKSLNDFLNRAKLQYFPELSDELHELQNCEECKDHLRLS